MRVERPPLLAQVNDDGQLKFTKEERISLDLRLSGLRGKRVEFDLRELEQTRSDQANRYYWSCVIAPAVAKNGDDDEDFHDEMCARFLTRRQIQVVDMETGEFVEMVIPGRSSKLKVHDFYLFVEKVRRFVGEFLGVETEDPDPQYWRKRSAVEQRSARLAHYQEDAGSNPAGATSSDA